MAKYLQIHGDYKYSSDETDNTLSESGVEIDPLHWRNIQQTYQDSKKAPWLILGILWTLSTIITVVTTAIITSNIQTTDSLGTLARGYLSDFAPARIAASSVQRTFTGSPRFSVEKGEYIPSDSPSMKYIGSTPEVDKAWADISKNRYFLLTDEEAKETWGDEYTEFWNDQRGGYLGGLDMFHTLHCLDHLRKSFYPDKYVLDGIHGEMHQIHCIDHLRQMIQCNADMTVIPTRYYESINQNYIDSDWTHTCRDFSKVREWASSRYNGELAVKPRHRNGTVWEDYYLPSEVV